MLIIRAGIHKMLVRKANREDHNQTTSSDSIFPNHEGFQPLKRQEKMHLKISSAGDVCYKELPNITDNLSTEANSLDPEQTAPIGAV